MSTVTTWQTTSESSETTEQLAERLGKVLRGGEVIELISDLGGGKTTFVRGLARGAQSPDKVASPTFTISKVYDAKKFQIHHFDFYRLQEPGIIVDELAEVIGDPKVVVVVEWADVVQHVLPAKRLTVKIQHSPEDHRKLLFQAPKELDYLIEAVKC
ncbi:MAG TPA: tRNA (adenosine(37)-N6)-threonylcarbamoyltransferase complex ATPase subunit type 1 TsaE [Patescibacteria group bacterium]|nr:tRNA (adenosine(37)-N6)-threonylcarbamoyltransferase complex ATPase subunit type 1 TsaE [Patescibacteria group bacterium]